MILDRNSLNQFDKWYPAAKESGANILINKDLDWTSFDVVAKLRGLLGIKKIGHAGTLDPLASGLLIIACGPFTKKISEFQDLDKVYTGTVRLGATTETDDSEMEEQNLVNYSDLTDDVIIKVCKSFEGNILQVPPKFSAKKVKGRRLYKMARKGIDVKIEPVEVSIRSIDVVKIELPYVTIDVKCSKGTYIRALARDIGEKLNKGAYLKSLERTAIGTFSVRDALTIQEISDLIVKYNAKNSQ